MPAELRETLKRGFRERVSWWVTQVSDSSGVILAALHERPKSRWFLTQMYARFWNDLADHASA